MLSQEVKLFVSHFSRTPSTRQCGEGNFLSCAILQFSETIMSLQNMTTKYFPLKVSRSSSLTTTTLKDSAIPMDTLKLPDARLSKTIVNKIFHDIHEHSVKQLQAFILFFNSFWMWNNQQPSFESSWHLFLFCWSFEHLPDWISKNYI